MVFDRGLNSKEISLFLEELPSDYEEQTDEEDEEDAGIPLSTNNDALDEDKILELNDDTTIIIVGDSVDSNQPANEENLIVVAPEELEEESSHGEQRKWRKKDEKSANIEFVPDVQCAKDISTPLDSFFLLFNNELFDKIHYESNLLSVQKDKPASITTDELKVFLGINMVGAWNDPHLLTNGPHNKTWRILLSNQQ